MNELIDPQCVPRANWTLQSDRVSVESGSNIDTNRTGNGQMVEESLSTTTLDQ
jgi:hypothetical protein